jgi:hypothetical protein
LIRRAACLGPDRATQYLRASAGLLEAVLQVGVNRQDRKANLIVKELGMKRYLVLVSVVATTVALQSLCAAPAMAWNRPDHIYVETNIKTPNGNSIAAFTRETNGDLTPIVGSPFLTGGAGTQYAGVNVGPQDSDAEIITNPEHTLLFAVNSGSDTIAVFVALHVKPDKMPELEREAFTA